MMSPFCFTRKLVRCTVAFLFCITHTAHAQPPDLKKIKNITDKIQAWAKYCDTFLGNSEDGKEDYPGLLVAGKQGLALCPDTSYKYRSLFNFYIGVGFENTEIIDSAIHYYEVSDKLGAQANSLRRRVNAMNRLEGCYYTLGIFGKRDSLIREASSILDTVKDQRIQSQLLGIYCNYYYRIGDYENAIDVMLKDIALLKESIANNSGAISTNVAVRYMEIAQVFEESGQYNKALEYLYYAAGGMTNFAEGSSNLYNNLITAHLHFDNTDSALFYYDLIYKLYSDTANVSTDYEELSHANRSLATYYLENKNLRQSENYALKALQLMTNANSVVSVTESNFVMGKILFEKKEYKNAISFFTKALEGAYESSRETFAEINKYLAKSYSATGEYEKAYSYFEIYSNLKDTLSKATSDKNIANAEARFQNKEKQDKIALQDLQLSAAYTQRAWLIAGIIAVLLTALLLYIIYRNKKQAAMVLDAKNKALEEANATKAKLFGIISHDLRSPISRVYQFLNLQKLNPQLLNDAQKEELSTKIQTATAALLETMEDLLLWSKTQLNDFNVSVQTVNIALLLQQSVELLQLDIETKQISIQNSLPADIMVQTDAAMLQAIIRNLLQNAIKASPIGAPVSISSSAIATHRILSIENGGPAFSQQDFVAATSRNNGSNSNGLGLQIVKELSLKINATIHFDTPETGGTNMQLSLPLNC